MVDLDKDVVVTSKFYMLRCLVTMAHADGVFCDLERGYMSAFLNHLPFADDQREQLLEDFDNPKPLSELFPFINEPKFRAQVAYFARIMAFKDGKLDPSEEELLERIKSYQYDGIDLEVVKADVKQAVSYEMAQHDITIDEMRPVSKGKFPKSYFEVIDMIALSLGIDLLRD
ncbi:MAG: hypothetical protein AAF549_05275 [Pseudomonadota bacterium]